MKRMDIFEEGTTINHQTILLGSTDLENSDRVPVMFGYSMEHPNLIGWAQNFERDEETHVISAEITFRIDSPVQFSDDFDDLYNIEFYSRINDHESVRRDGSYIPHSNIKSHTIKSITIVPLPGFPMTMKHAVPAASPNFLERSEEADKLDEILVDQAAEEIGVPAEFLQELTTLINKHSMENGSNTPDYILAEYLSRQLVAYNIVAKARDAWRSDY